MQTLRQAILDASSKKVAIGHFNISDSEQLWGIFNAAKSLDLPVIVGVSEGERDFIGVRQVVALVKSIREQYDYPIFINADHTYSFERVKEAVDAGFDSVIFDGTKLPLEENIKIARECVGYAESIDSDLIVEGEIGYIGTSSKVLDEIPKGAAMDESALPKPEDVERFVEETGVDLLAPAVGNIHGMLRAGADPALRIDLVETYREVGKVPLVLHGASGNSDDDIKAAIAAGVSIVHVNTEIRVAYRKGIQISLQEDPEEVAPYKFMKPGVKAVEDVVSAKLKVFNNIN